MSEEKTIEETKNTASLGYVHCQTYK